MGRGWSLYTYGNPQKRGDSKCKVIKKGSIPVKYRYTDCFKDINKPHPIAFNQALKLHIKTRDHSMCVQCGSADNLCIHHLDYDKQNCSEYNLVTLCTPCHDKTNHHRKEWVMVFKPLINKIYNTRIYQ